MVLPLLFGALAPGLLAGTGMSALTASALGAGLGGFAQTGDLEQGLLTGLGAFAGGSLLGPLMGGSAAGASPEMLAAQVPAGQTAVGQGANAMTALAPGNAGIAGIPTGQLMPPPSALAASQGGQGMGGMFGGAMDFMKSPQGMGVGVGAMAGPALGQALGLGMGDDGGDKKSMSKYGGKEAAPIPRIPTMPGADYQPGTSGEFNYGVGTPYSAAQIMDYTNRGVRPYADGGMLHRMANPTMPGIGPVRLARGGIVALAEGGDPGAQQPMPNEREVISGAVAAVKGEHPQPEIALGAFLATYGEEALRQLVDAVKSGAMEDTAERFSTGENGAVVGPGDGTGVDDMVPAKMDDGSGDVLLSDGEFVLRKDSAQALEKKFGGGLLDEVNNAGGKAADAAQRRMAAA